MMFKLYAKEKVIGSGTYGNIWLVKSKTTRSRYVLKEVNLANFSTSEREQALNEVTILSRCNHANIIGYKEAIVNHDTNTLSIIMEYADGGDLYTSIIKQDGVPFKEHVIMTWFIQICLALQYIHHKNILHRDLKSRNVFLTRNKTVKIGDFGIARCLSNSDQLATTAIGTPYYLSPEICQRKPYNYKSDIWALGCILFEMAALSHPFQACNFPNLLTSILAGKRKELPRHCSSLIKNLIQLLLVENSEVRPSTDEILALPDLQSYLSEIWISQSKDSASKYSVDQRIVIKRHSLGKNFKPTNATPVRTSSISSAETRSTRNYVASKGGKLKDTLNLKPAVRSRCISVKESRNSLPSNPVKSDFHYLTYRVFHPLALKKQSEKLPSKGLFVDSSNPLKGKKNEDHHRNNKCAETEDSFKTISCESRSSKKIISNTTSTRENICTSEIFLEKTSIKNAFDNLAFEDDESLDVKQASQCCEHSQCYQCILDLLWKNRIRGTVASLPNKKQPELNQKLRYLFGKDLFDTLYKTLVSNWEINESDSLPAALKKITNSLNYSQLQHFPLMLQLVQLDILAN